MQFYNILALTLVAEREGGREEGEEVTDSI
jgi:hypothetical protein